GNYRTTLCIGDGIRDSLLYENRNGLSFEALQEKTQLPLIDVAAAVGWLAREDKLQFLTDDQGNQKLSVFQDFFF
ncbi:MAG: winged helix-turn-helix domain-containing protein, partial [Alloprevotella sp.]